MTPGAFEQRVREEASHFAFIRRVVTLDKTANTVKLRRLWSTKNPVGAPPAPGARHVHRDHGARWLGQRLATAESSLTLYPQLL